MNGKTSKLIRRAAKSNPFEIEEKHMNSPTKYMWNKSKTELLIHPGLRMTYKKLKDMYKHKILTTDDLRNYIIFG